MGLAIAVAVACSDDGSGTTGAVAPDAASDVSGNARLTDATFIYCGGDPQTFVLQGEQLATPGDAAAAPAPQVCLTPESGGGESCVPQTDIVEVSASEVRFTVRKSHQLSPGDYAVSFTSADGVQVSGSVTLRVLAAEPLLLWSDPGVVYNGISTPITLYGSGLDQELIEQSSSFSLRPSAGQGAETSLETTVTSPLGNRVHAIVPAGTSPGTYDVRLRVEGACEAVVTAGVTVVDAVDLPVSAIVPPFGWTAQETPVTISAQPAELVQVPRAYLIPANPTSATVATALRSMTWLDAGHISGVVPAQLAAGEYDLIVVNPSGRAGRLARAFTVTMNPPPVVNNVSPSYLATGLSSVTVTVEGSGFDSPTVTAICEEPDGAIKTLFPTPSAGTGTSLDISLSTADLARDAVCIFRITNADSSYAEYSGIGVKNPATNLGVFREGPAMTTPRRAAAVTVAQATPSARFLYAIGGDNGNPAGALSSVEVARIDGYGTPGSWSVLPVPLPSPRTLAGVVTVGRFIYLIGGNDGSGPVGTLLRAEVLPPSDAPEIVDVSAVRALDAGIGAGLWMYRVSAVMADDNDANAGGETLPSDPFTVDLPVGQSVIVTLIWEPVPGAKAYRVYRSPTGDRNQAFGSERLVATIDAPSTTYQDVAPAGQAGQVAPLRLGATGVWMTSALPAAGFADLTTAREAPGVAAARDPVNASSWHVYAIGGRSDSGALASYEHMSVTVATNGSHAVTSWAAGTQGISSARSELTAYAVSHAEAQQVPVGTTYIYAGGGRESTNVDVASVVPGGALAWSPVRAMGTLRSGYAGVAGGGHLHVFGGGAAAPSDSTISGEIDPASAPALVNWNASERLTRPRYLAGGAAEGASVYLVGGQTTTGPTATTERSLR